MMYYYEGGRRVNIGDRVRYLDEPAVIVFIIEEGKFLSPYRSEDWDYLREGLGVLLDDGQLFVLHAQNPYHLIRQSEGADVI